MLPGLRFVALPSAATTAVRDREKRTAPDATRYKQAERRGEGQVVRW